MVGVDFIVLLRNLPVYKQILIRTLELNRGILGEIAEILLKVGEILNLLQNCES